MSDRKLPEWAVVGAEVVMVRNGRPYAVGTISRVTVTSAFVGSVRFVTIGRYAENKLQAYGYASNSWYSSHAVNAESEEGKLLVAREAKEALIRKLQAGWQTFIAKPTQEQANDLAKLLTSYAQGVNSNAH